MVVGIDTIEYSLPEGVLSNTDLIGFFPGWSEEKIFNKLGIKERHIARPDELVSDMAIGAAKRLFDNANCDPESIDYLILCTQSPDFYLPATACIIQEKLGLGKNIGAFDFNQGCSGYIYGLSICKGLIQTGIARKILFITAETYSKHINKNDKSTRTIFGDAATASIIMEEPSLAKIRSFDFGTDGSGYRNLIVPAGGMALPKSEDTRIEREDEDGNVRSSENLYMNGSAIYDFCMETVPITVEKLLNKEKLSIEEIDFFVFHQANKFMVDSLRKKMKIDKDKVTISLENVGNTVSCTIPIAIKEMQKEGKLKKGQIIMLVGFGVGYSWGSTIIETR